MRSDTASGVTLKDISEELHVSVTTVHRAISGKEGISDALRERILQTADEMGYKFNYAASSIKRAPRRVAAILPDDEKLYYHYIWKGLRDMAEEARTLNMELEEFVCRDEQHEYELLRQIADTGSSRYAGVVAFSYTRATNVLLQLQRLVAQNIVTVVIDDEIKEPEGLYHVPSNEKVVGKLAGELIAMITPESGTVFVSVGRTDSKIHVNKLQSFTQYLQENKKGLTVQKVEGYQYCTGENTEKVPTIREALDSCSDAVACFAQTSKDNKLMVDVIREQGLIGRVPIIGTDLNESSAEMLRRGELKAIINQGAYKKGYAALEVLVNRIVKQTAPRQRVDCPIDIVLQENLNFYESLNAF